MADLESSIIEADITPGKPVRLSERVTRITAPNPGPMTGPGTNTYLVGSDEVTVIDPGPNIDSHVQAILKAGGDRIRHVAVTHTHPDHSPAAMPIARATGAALYGAVLDDDGHQDLSFRPTVDLRPGHLLSTPEYSLEALFTPGHVGNHYCFYLREEKTVFTGDHIMQGTTVVIIPPSGDMLDYIESLQRLTRREVDRLAPAHGHLMTDAHGIVSSLIKHRLGREEKVLDSLRQAPNSNLDGLMKIAYADLPDPRLYKIARLSLWAHLLKLEKEGRAEKHAEKHWLFDDELWRLSGSM